MCVLSAADGAAGSGCELGIGAQILRMEDEIVVIRVSHRRGAYR